MDETKIKNLVKELVHKNIQEHVQELQTQVHILQEQVKELQDQLKCSSCGDFTELHVCENSTWGRHENARFCNDCLIEYHGDKLCKDCLWERGSN